MKVEDIPVSLGDYKGLVLQPMEIATSDEAVEARFRELMDRVVAEEPVSGSVRKGDTVVVSYEGRMGKRSFPGSSCSECRVKVGSGTLIEGFEEHLVGRRRGDEVSFALNFPHAHINEELQGRLARFEVVVREVYRKPEDAYGDDCVRKVSEFQSADELRGAIREQMEAENAAEERRFLKASARQALADIAQADVPDELVDEQTVIAIEDMRASVEAQGGSWSDHVTRLGRTEDEFASETRAEVRKGILASLALAEIARRENLAVSASDLSNEAAALAAASEVPLEEVLDALGNAEFRKDMERSILHDKALALVLEYAVAGGGDCR